MTQTKKANSEWARRKRAAQWLEQAKHATRCPKRVGPGICGGPLETVIDRAFGRTVLVCPWCTRQARGICIDCSLPVAGKVGYARRCAVHKEIAQAAQVRASQVRHRDERNQRARERTHVDEAARQRKLEYKRAWRKANPDKIKRQKRRAALRQPKRVRVYQARYRAKHREHYREMALAAYYAEHPTRPQPKPCTKCGGLVAYEPPGRPPVKCDDCVFPCERREREASRARRAAARAAAAAAAAAPVKPKKVRRPRGVAVRVESGKRRCPTAGCPSLLTGRAKKCETCKAAERAAAAAALAARRGRGRRTDLQGAA